MISENDEVLDFDNVCNVLFIFVSYERQDI